MRFVKISQNEMKDVRELYEGIMSFAYHGLFYKEGAILGREIATTAKAQEEFFDSASHILIERGWASSIEFQGNRVLTENSIEIQQSNVPTCHRLRGIIKALYHGASVNCRETECQSTGAPRCVFKIELSQ